MTTKEKLQERLRDLLFEAYTLFLDMWNGAKTRDEQIKLMNKNFEFYVNHMISNGVTVLEHGEWKKKMIGNGWDNWEAFTCSICGTHYEKPSRGMKYCPNCGSRMTGEEEVTPAQDFEEAEE